MPCVCQSILSPSPESSISSHCWLWPMKGEGDPIRAPKDFWGALAFHQSVSSNSAVSLQCVWVRHLILKFRVAFLRQGLWEVIRVKWGQECGGLHDDPGGFGGRGRETWDGTFSLSCLACVASSVPGWSKKALTSEARTVLLNFPAPKSICEIKKTSFFLRYESCLELTFEVSCLNFVFLLGFASCPSILKNSAL